MTTGFDLMIQSVHDAAYAKGMKDSERLSREIHLMGVPIGELMKLLYRHGVLGMTSDDQQNFFRTIGQRMEGFK